MELLWGCKATIGHGNAPHMNTEATFATCLRVCDLLLVQLKLVHSWTLLLLRKATQTVSLSAFAHFILPLDIADTVDNAETETSTGRLMKR